MIESFIGTTAFRRGINQYLLDHSYGNAARADLWAAYDAAAAAEGTLEAGLDVYDIMETWTTQAGLPVVTVVSTADDQSSVTLEQKRFYYNPEADTDEMWYVPISVAYPADPDDAFGNSLPEIWIRPEDVNGVNLDITSFPYVINVQEMGYYRVNYDRANWEALLQVMTDSPLDIGRLNRAQIYDDSLNLARADQLEYTMALNFTKNLMNERDYIPLQAGLTGMAYIDKMLRDFDQAYEYLNSYIVKILENNFNDSGFQTQAEDTYVDVYKRSSLIDWACLSGLPSCVAQALDDFSEWMEETDPDTENPIGPDLKMSVYEVAIREGGQAEFDFLLARLDDVQVEQDVSKIIYGLASSTNVENLNQLLEMTIDRESVIRSQDAIYVFRGIGATSIGRRAQFDWLKDNYDRIKGYFGSSNGVSSGFAAMVEDLLAGFTDAANTEEEAQEVEDFLEVNIADLGSIEPAIRSGIDNINANIRWMELNFDEVVDWLRDDLGIQDEVTTEDGSDNTTDSGNGATTDGANALSIAILPFILGSVVSAIV